MPIPPIMAEGTCRGPIKEFQLVGSRGRGLSAGCHPLNHGIAQSENCTHPFGFLKGLENLTLQIGLNSGVAVCHTGGC